MAVSPYACDDVEPNCSNRRIAFRTQDIHRSEASLPYAHEHEPVMQSAFEIVNEIQNPITKSRYLNKSLVAASTSERPLASVYSDMPRQVTSTGERFVALVTYMRNIGVGS